MIQHEDAHYELLWDSEICFGVLGRGGEFVLIDMGRPIDEAVTAEAVAKGFVYCGVVAFKDGACGAQCIPDVDCMLTMVYAGLAAAQLMADRLRRPEEKGDSVSWLQELYGLPDVGCDDA